MSVSSEHLLNFITQNKTITIAHTKKVHSHDKSSPVISCTFRERERETFIRPWRIAHTRGHTHTHTHKHARERDRLMLHFCCSENVVAGFCDSVFFKTARDLTDLVRECCSTDPAGYHGRVGKIDGVLLYINWSL